VVSIKERLWKEIGLPDSKTTCEKQFSLAFSSRNDAFPLWFLKKTASEN